MLHEQLIRRFGGWLARAERILLITHESPDGDGISSVLAMQQALLAQGKVVTCVSRDPVPPAFQFLPNSQAFRTDFFIGDYDLVITFDCGDSRRTGFDDRLRWFAETKKRLVNVDHHPKNDLHRLANLNLVDFSVAATAQIVYQIFHSLSWPIDYRIATCLLCGLYTDTGGFKHPNTTSAVLEIAANLLGHGGRLQEINRHLRNARSVAMLRLWGLALDRLHCHHEYGIVASMITLGDLQRCQATHADVAGVVNLIKNIPNTRIAIIFAEQIDGSIRVSLRSDAAGVDVTRLAALFGGGGIKKSGGFSIPGQLIYQQNGWQIGWN